MKKIGLVGILFFICTKVWALDAATVRSVLSQSQDLDQAVETLMQDDTTAEVTQWLILANQDIVDVIRSLFNNGASPQAVINGLVSSGFTAEEAIALVNAILKGKAQTTDIVIGGLTVLSASALNQGNGGGGSASPN